MRFLIDVKKTTKSKKYRIVEWISTLEILRDVGVKRALKYIYRYGFKQFDLQDCITYVYRALMFSPRMLKRLHYLMGRWGFWFQLLPLTYAGIYLVSYVLAQIIGGWFVFLSAFFLFTFYTCIWVSFKGWFQKYVPQGMNRVKFFTESRRKRSRKYLVNTALRLKYLLTQSQNTIKLKPLRPKRRWNLGQTAFHEYQFTPPKPLDWFSNLSLNFLNDEKFTLYHHTSYYRNDLVVDPISRSKDDQEQLKKYIIEKKKLKSFENEFRLMGLIGKKGTLSIQKIYSKNYLFEHKSNKQAVVACYALCWTDKFKNKTPILALGPWFVDIAVKKPWYVLLHMQVYEEAFDRGYRIRSDIDKLRISNYRKSSILGWGNAAPLKLADFEPSWLSLYTKKLLRRCRRKLLSYVRFLRTQWLLKEYRLWLLSEKLRWLEANLWRYILLEYNTRYVSKYISNYIFWSVDALGCKYLKRKELAYQDFYIWFAKHYTSPIERKHIIFTSTLYERYWTFWRTTLPKTIIYKKFLPWLQYFFVTLFSVFFKDILRLLPIIYLESSHYADILYKRFLKFIKGNSCNNNCKNNNNEFFKAKVNDANIYQFLFGLPIHDGISHIRLMEEIYERFTTRNRLLLMTGLRSNIAIYEQRLLLQAETLAWTGVWAGKSYDWNFREVLKFSYNRPLIQFPQTYGTLEIVRFFVKRNFAMEINSYHVTYENYSDISLAIHGALHFDHLIRLPIDSRKDDDIAFGSWNFFLDNIILMGGYNQITVWNYEAYLRLYVDAVVFSHLGKIRKYQQYRLYHKINVGRDRSYWKLEAFMEKLLIFRTINNIKIGVPKYKRHKTKQSSILRLKYQYLTDHIHMLWCIYNIEFYSHRPAILASSARFRSSDSLFLCYQSRDNDFKFFATFPTFPKDFWV